jgi:hypothetical protein
VVGILEAGHDALARSEEQNIDLRRDIHKHKIPINLIELRVTHGLAYQQKFVRRECSIDGGYPSPKLGRRHEFHATRHGYRSFIDENYLLVGGFAFVALASTS